MNDYFFDRSKFDRLYNCSILSYEKWESMKQPNVPVGLLYIFTSTFYQIAYIPFLVVMLKPDFIQYSCYKLMFFLGIIDLGATITGGTLCGIISIRGDIYCTNPELVYFSGALGTMFWVGACATGMILVLNRILDLINIEMAKRLFGGYKTLGWLLIPSGYMFYELFFTLPLIFNSRLEALFVNPHGGIDEIMDDSSIYHNYFVATNNIIVSIAFPFLYFMLCLILVLKSRKASGSKISSVQKQLILQSILVSIVLVLSSVLYVCMQFFYVPHEIIILAHFLWQASHGASVVAYIFVNRTMKKAAIKIVKKITMRNHSVHVGPSNT